MTRGPEDFYLDKWYLDCITEEGGAMIFYAARLRWRRFGCTYASWLQFEPGKGVNTKSRFGRVWFPEPTGKALTWTDTRFGVSGRWESGSTAVCERLFESEEGYLEWNCRQPASIVTLKIGDRTITGKGYAEQLTITIPPWKLNLDFLRWGRFGMPGNNIVWIEWEGDTARKWTWLNGDPVADSIVENDRIMLPSAGLVLSLDRHQTLESEKKVESLVASLLRYLPGIDRSITLKFLMADETKWLSRGVLQKDGEIINLDFAIHELVTF